MITIKTYYLEEMDKPKIFRSKLRIENDCFKIGLNIEKNKNIQKLINRLNQLEANNVVLSKELLKNKGLINSLNASNIKIFDGRWLIKYLAIDILNYIILQKNIKKQETEIAVTLNEITDLSIEIIKILSKQYKKLTIVTNHIEKLKKIEKEIYDREGILIIISNNKNKSLLKSQIILNMDFNKELLNQYRIFDDAIILNLEGDMKIDSIRFQGIVINDYEVTTGRQELIWRENMDKFVIKDLLEAVFYAKDTFKNIRKRLQKSNISITSLYGVNGVINFNSVEKIA